MKKIGLVIVISIVSITLSACSDQNEQASKTDPKVTHNQTKVTNKDVREDVWEQLTEEKKEHIVGSGKEASIQQITLREGMGMIKDNNFIGKEVYLVDFPSDEDNPTLGGIGVYADSKSHKIIGFGYRD
ncbi:hypothetical protein Q7A53_10215 [Halobacillus rhizosphaerae]|uniref:hypothetical protein n=1 Tax=Halobacillus rhizosphaerae TaxID=3064889 RepID=UPI00398A9026